MERKEVWDILSEQIQRLNKFAEEGDVYVNPLDKQVSISYAMSGLAEAMAKVATVPCMADFDERGRIKAVKPLGKIF